MKINSDSTLIVYPKFLWILTLTYVMVIVLANWFNVRLIQIFGLNTDAGTLVFPLTFLLCDMITEVYGYKYARRAIWCGFAFNIVFILYGLVVTNLPGPDYATHNDMFDELLKFNIRIIIASIISYFIAEPINSFIMAKLKIKLVGKYMGIRFVSSTFVAAGLDSIIFGLIAFYGMMSHENLFYLILTMWFIKVSIEIIGLPFSIKLTKKLKAIEQLDIYDKSTRFNLFTWDAHYSKQDNQYYK